jgi:hypothetical protein
MPNHATSAKGPSGNKASAYSPTAPLADRLAALRALVTAGKASK